MHDQPATAAEYQVVAALQMIRGHAVEQVVKDDVLCHRTQHAPVEIDRRGGGHHPGAGSGVEVEVGPGSVARRVALRVDYQRPGFLGHVEIGVGAEPPGQAFPMADQQIFRPIGVEVGETVRPGWAKAVDQAPHQHQALLNKWIVDIDAAADEAGNVAMDHAVGAGQAVEGLRPQPGGAVVEPLIQAREVCQIGLSHPCPGIQESLLEYLLLLHGGAQIDAFLGSAFGGVLQQLVFGLLGQGAHHMPVRQAGDHDHHGSDANCHRQGGAGGQTIAKRNRRRRLRHSVQRRHRVSPPPGQARPRCQRSAS